MRGLSTAQVPLGGISFNEDIVIGLGVLISWKQTMGVIDAYCTSGCSCTPKHFSTWLSHAGWSMTFWQFMEAKVKYTFLPCEYIGHLLTALCCSDLKCPLKRQACIALSIVKLGSMVCIQRVATDGVEHLRQNYLFSIPHPRSGRNSFVLT